MSNASNLSNLANVLDDANAGEFLKSTGSGGVAFDTVAAGATVYSSASDLPLTGNTVGDMAYVSAATTAKVVNQTTGSVSTEDATRLYIYSGTGWYSVAFITQNPTINTVQDAGGGSTPFTLATDGTTATVVTITANDPESVPLTYSYGITNGALNGCTITGADGTSARVAGTAYTDNVFTVTPHASNDATFTITFTASDGINQATSANAFSLSFVTIVTDSKYTSLLATATAASDNNNITDSSSNSHSITVNGDAYAGTFSPYRSGGYSTYFDGNGDYIEHQGTFTLPAGTNGNWTIECWVNLDQVNLNQGILRVSSTAANGNNDDIYFSEQSGYLVAACKAGGINSGTSAFAMTANTWHHIAMVKNNGTIYLYNNGVYCGSLSDSNSYYGSYYVYGGLYYSSSYCFAGHLSDFRISNSAIYTSGTSDFTVPEERLSSDSSTLFLTCHLPYIADGSTNDHSITVNGDVSTKPFSPYNYEEYSATDNGGSVYFDGNGDYLSISNQGISGDLTYEGWFYQTVAQSATWRALLSSSTYGSGTPFQVYTYNTNIEAWVSGSGGAGIITAPFKPFTWFHVAIVRSSNIWSLYVNGKLANTNTVNGTYNFASTTGWSVGAGQTGLYPFTGYASDVRLINSAITDFTPPTSPKSSSGASLHIKGTDASIIDKSQRYNIDLGSTSIVGHSTTKWSGAKSIYIDSKSNNSDIITIPAGVLNASEPFTIEMWLRTISGSTSGFWTIYQNGSNEMRLKMRSDDRIEFYHRGSGANAQELKDETNTLGLNNTDFYHVAITRDANAVFYLHQNGIKLGNFTANGNYDSSAVEFKIGTSAPGSSKYTQGYIQDFRITQGLARYTAADETANIPSAPLEG